MFGVLFFLIAGAEPGRGEQAQWEKEWEKTLAAANKEGKLVYHSGTTSEAFFQAFQKRFPKIKAIRMLTRGGSSAAQRLMAERRAGLYATDVFDYRRYVRIPASYFRSSRSHRAQFDFAGDSRSL